MQYLAIEYFHKSKTCNRYIDRSIVAALDLPTSGLGRRRRVVLTGHCASFPHHANKSKHRYSCLHAKHPHCCHMPFSGGLYCIFRGWIKEAARSRVLVQRIGKRFLRLVSSWLDTAMPPWHHKHLLKPVEYGYHLDGLCLHILSSPAMLLEDARVSCFRCFKLWRR
jgi:hypothetical protein